MNKGAANKPGVYLLYSLITVAVIAVFAILYINNKPKQNFKPKRMPAPFVFKTRINNNVDKLQTYDSAAVKNVELKPSLGFRNDSAAKAQYATIRTNIEQARENIKDIPFFAYDNNDGSLGGLFSASNLVAIHIQHKVAINELDEAEAAINEQVAFLNFLRSNANTSVREYGDSALASLNLSILENLSIHPTTIQQRKVIRSWLLRCNNTSSYPMSEIINMKISEHISHLNNTGSRGQIKYIKYYKQLNVPAPPYPEKKTKEALIQFANQLQVAATQGEDYSPEQTIALQTVLNENRVQPNPVDPVSVALHSEIVNLPLIVHYTDQLTLKVANFHLDLLDFVDEHTVLPKSDQIQIPEDPFLKKPMQFALKSDPNFEVLTQASFNTPRRVAMASWVISTPIHPVFTFGTEGTMMPENGSYFGGVPPQMLAPNADSPKAVK